MNGSNSTDVAATGVAATGVAATGVAATDVAATDVAATEVASTERRATRPLVGRVVSDKMNKTVTVLVERRVRHPLYKKYIRRSTRIHAHDETDSCNVGDSVSIVQCRPLSRTKAWRVHEIIARAK